MKIIILIKRVNGYSTLVLYVLMLITSIYLSIAVLGVRMMIMLLQTLALLRVQANVAMAVPKIVTKTIKAAAPATAPTTMKVISKFGLNASRCSEWT